MQGEAGATKRGHWKKFADNKRRKAKYIGIILHNWELSSPTGILPAHLCPRERTMPSDRHMSEYEHKSRVQLGAEDTPVLEYGEWSIELRRGLWELSKATVGDAPYAVRVLNGVVKERHDSAFINVHGLSKMVKGLIPWDTKRALEKLEELRARGVGYPVVQTDTE
ncbi:hypothetical protein HBH92_151930 [Parastagonospora nodorum]|nr:hypothetical protein HBH92_151930 [Parastagonospora nodorum]KAH4442274.1 hypothetical protein HBH93_075940 [Parastagonospora nodorum]KAH4453677.1 hypothetical protein HBH91_104160 [Parastagonospora nodorum]KAH4510425.1 hypothetical protein HBH89_054480 [Parastagonospora nodorum]KAH4546427.1 hypothetical protein HBH86_137870 [Parastagonospora nodorum]